MPKIRKRLIVLQVLSIIVMITAVIYRVFLKPKNFPASVIKGEPESNSQQPNINQTQKYRAGSPARSDDRLNYFIHNEYVRGDWLDDLFIRNRLDDFFYNVRHKTEAFFDNKGMREWYLHTKLQLYK